MSHYSVAVFSNNPKTDSFIKLLAPYNETDKNYFIFKEIPADQLQEEYTEFLKRYPSYDQYTIEQYIKDRRYIVTDGKVGYEYNPNGKWDYYTLNARNDMFDPKPGEKQYCRHYRKSQLNFFPKQEEKNLSHVAEFWDEYVEEGNTENHDSFYSREYYKERYGTKEQYIKELSRTVPYAFITPDGVWHAPGNVGWFGCSDETAESMDKYYEDWSNFINDTSNDPYVSIVDCHI